ncbi:zinc ribbon domain-containing protein, partial [Streptomyces aureus]|uniref:zinc ribbon domain-containing protein n=1 Tax=Streptomyces aureus TaxID=193461 RepID=UPI0031E0B9F5
MAKAELPLHVRVFECDACGLVMDRDENAARNLADLASACITGTAVAADQGTQVPKPRGGDHKTRATRTRRKTGAGRAGGEIPQQRAEARDRRRCHRSTHALVTPSRTIPAERSGLLKADEAFSNGLPLVKDRHAVVSGPLVSRTGRIRSRRNARGHRLPLPGRGRHNDDA